MLLSSEMGWSPCNNGCWCGWWNFRSHLPDSYVAWSFKIRVSSLVARHLSAVALLYTYFSRTYLIMLSSITSSRHHWNVASIQFYYIIISIIMIRWLDEKWVIMVQDYKRMKIVYKSQTNKNQNKEENKINWIKLTSLLVPYLE